ncbi:MFS transporter [Actinomadura gamaensis]|uniref:MFS transporter n=1 Tax=Actinomadura gamaensis TaxID=1763541 RepID=A0ABV9TY05_9ACTN
MRLDWEGVLLLGGTIATVILAATWAGVRYAWTSPQIIGLGALAFAGLVAFVVTQRRVADPLLPPRVFAHRNMRLASAIVLIVGAVMFTGALYLPLYQQTVQHASAADSGLLLLPMMIPMVLASQLPGRVMTRTGRYKIFPIAGGAALTLGAALLASLDASSGRVETSVYMAVVGIGLGLTMQMTTTIAQNSVEMRDIGAATAATTLFRTLGGTLAVAAFGALYTRSVLHAGQIAGSAQGFSHIYTGVAILCALAFVAALFVKEVPLRGKPKIETAETPAVSDAGRGVSAR